MRKDASHDHPPRRVYKPAKARPCPLAFSPFTSPPLDLACAHTSTSTFSTIRLRPSHTMFSLCTLLLAGTFAAPALAASISPRQAADNIVYITNQNDFWCAFHAWRAPRSSLTGTPRQHDHAAHQAHERRRQRASGRDEDVLLAVGPLRQRAGHAPWRLLDERGLRVRQWAEWRAYCSACVFGRMPFWF